MGIRVSIPTKKILPGYAGSPVADNYLNGVRQLQGPVDSLGSLGGLAQGSLQAARHTLDASTINPLDSIDASIELGVGSLNNNLGIALRVGPPRHLQGLSGITTNVSRMATSATSAFEYAKDAVTGTNGIIALALMAACLLIATLLQGEMAKLTAAALRMQRAALASIDNIRKQVVDLIEESLDAAMEVLPDCPQQVKDVISELRSLLGKASTMVAAVGKILRDVAACAAIGVAIASVVSGSSSGVSRRGYMYGLTNKSRVLVSFDLGSMKRKYGDGLNSSKDRINSNRDFYEDSPYLKDTTTGNIQGAIAEAEEALDKINDLIEDSKKQDLTPYPDSPEYKEALDKAKENLDKLIEDLKEAEDRLLEETIGIIDRMTEDALAALEDLRDGLDGETDEILKATDDVLEGLENVAKEFDSPEVLERLATACAETQFRSIIDG